MNSFAIVIPVVLGVPGAIPKAKGAPRTTVCAASESILEARLAVDVPAAKVTKSRLTAKVIVGQPVAG